MTAETGPWMPMYWADYIADTTHLSTEEHGAYLLLIGAYWRRGEALPDDDKWLANVTKSNRQRWALLRKVIGPLFEIRGGSWLHKRLEKEILKSTERYNSARANGRAGGLAKAKLVTVTVTTREEERMSSLRSDTAQSDSKVLEFQKPKKASKHKIPDDFEPDRGAAVAYWMRKGRDDLGPQIEDIIEDFRAHHHKLGTRFEDWGAGWRTWYSNAPSRSKPPANGNGHGIPTAKIYTTADLDLDR